LESAPRAEADSKGSTMKMALKLAFLVAAAVLSVTAARAQIHVGAQAAEASAPFVMTRVASFNQPWRIAFLPDRRMLITERVGPIWLVTQAGHKTKVANVPAVLAQGQGGMLGVFLSPHYAADHEVYLTYSAREESRAIFWLLSISSPAPFGSIDGRL